MAPPVPQTEPQILVAGDSWAWTKTLSNYPPSEGWTVGYAVRGQSVLANTDVVVVTSGAGYSVSVAKAKTTPLVAGAYKWQSFVDGSGAHAGEHYTIEEGVFTIEPNLSAIVDNSAVTHVERMIARIDAEIEARLSGNGSAHESYSINGRAIGKIKMTELMNMGGMYRARLYRLRNQGAFGPSVLAVMQNPDGTIGTSEPIVLPPWYRALNS